MMKTIIFLGVIAAIHCQPLNVQYFEEQQPISSYYPEEFAQEYRERRSVQDSESQQPASSYYDEEFEPEYRERRSVQDLEGEQPISSYYLEEYEPEFRERRSVQDLEGEQPISSYYLEEYEPEYRERRSVQDYEDEQPISSYYSGQSEPQYRERRSVQQPINSYYPEELESQYRERRSVYDGEANFDVFRDRRSVQEEPDQFYNGGIIDQHPALALYYSPREFEEIEALERHRRSLQPGAPTFPLPEPQIDTKVTPHVTEQGGTTNVGAKIDRKFGNHDASVYWNKNVRGPQRAKPNWGVRGTYRF